MQISKDQIVGELVAKDYRTATVFKSFGIDFCCKGNRTIDEVCNTQNLKADVLIDDLEKVTGVNENQTTEYRTWPLDLLADYIEKKHHRYVQTRTEEIKPFLDKLCKVHGNRHPELFEINDLFKAGSGELAVHMKKEELILFPYVRKMVYAKEHGMKQDAPHFGTVQNPIAMMMSEHSIEGERFRKISELSNNYTPPEDGCNTYRVTFALLKEFEDDLHLHIHLENNILFPKAIELEKTLAGN